MSVPTAVRRPKRFCVIYRTGGYENFMWNRAFDLHYSRERAEAHADVVRSMGYPALVADYDLSLSIGLPETFDPTCEVKES